MLLELKSDVEPPEAFASLEKEHPLEKYLLEELEAMFRKISGESLKEVLLPADKPFDLEEARLLVQSALLYENSVETPR